MEVDYQEGLVVFLTSYEGAQFYENVHIFFNIIKSDITSKVRSPVQATLDFSMTTNDYVRWEELHIITPMYLELCTMNELREELMLDQDSYVSFSHSILGLVEGIESSEVNSPTYFLYERNTELIEKVKKMYS